jgi:DNA-binding NarL/FixJ family response regulator
MLAALLRDSETAEQTGFIVSRADDRPLAEGIGIDPLAVVDPVSTLTSRERDVYNLLCEGLSNAEIGRRLFISSPTVKVHVRHVYDKLGIRSRTAVALHAASRRAQENPTARGGDSGSSVAEG